ncbi:hypothetical protein F2P81_026158 [Scophthalmus maximus]|nr:hypothetical protein F2P81_026158 [Scophthalmus maximus]
MVVTMVVCYLVCWLPYGVAALLATFGSRDLLTPEATITPSLLAKFSTVINPFIYIFMNKQVRRPLPLWLLHDVFHHHPSALSFVYIPYGLSSDDMAALIDMTATQKPLSDMHQTP